MCSTGHRGHPIQLRLPDQSSKLVATGSEGYGKRSSVRRVFIWRRRHGIVPVHEPVCDSCGGFEGMVSLQISFNNVHCID